MVLLASVAPPPVKMFCAVFELQLPAARFPGGDQPGAWLKGAGVKLLAYWGFGKVPGAGYAGGACEGTPPGPGEFPVPAESEPARRAAAAALAQGSNCVVGGGPAGGCGLSAAAGAVAGAAVTPGIMVPVIGAICVNIGFGAYGIGHWNMPGFRGMLGGNPGCICAVPLGSTQGFHGGHMGSAGSSGSAA